MLELRSSPARLRKTGKLLSKLFMSNVQNAAFLSLRFPISFLGCGLTKTVQFVFDNFLAFLAFFGRHFRREGIDLSVWLAFENFFLTQKVAKSLKGGRFPSQSFFFPRLHRRAYLSLSFLAFCRPFKLFGACLLLFFPLSMYKRVHVWQTCWHLFDPRMLSFVITRVLSLCSSFIGKKNRFKRTTTKYKQCRKASGNISN